MASIPYSLVSQYGKSEITNSFYKTLEAKSGHKIGHSNQTISAVQASEQIAEYLEIKRGDAILRVRQVSILKTDYLLNMFVRSMQEVDLSFI